MVGGSVAEIGDASILSFGPFENNSTIAQLILAWTIRSGSVITIPKASTKEKLVENLETLTMTFSQDSLVKISNIFKPEVKRYLGEFALITRF